MHSSLTTHSLEAAAHEAAIADGVLANGLDMNDIKNRKAGLRRGKWTAEEECYANRLIQEFKSGLLPLSDGTTLRTFLSKLLNCDPMRISKKFVGGNCIGKQVFRRRPQELEKLSQQDVENSRRELAELERRFLERVAQTNRSKNGTSKPRDEIGDTYFIGMDGDSSRPWLTQPSYGNNDFNHKLNNNIVLKNNRPTNGYVNNGHHNGNYAATTTTNNNNMNAMNMNHQVPIHHHNNSLNNMNIH